MSGPTVDPRNGNANGASELVARAATGSARARRRKAGEIRDLLSDGEVRLDDRTRMAAAASIDAVVRAIAQLVRTRAVTWLRDHDGSQLADRLEALSVERTVALADAGILSETALIGEILGRVGESLLAERLPIDGAGDGDDPGIALRLTGARDVRVADAARALIGADAARRAELHGMPSSGDLPSPLRAHLAWPIATLFRAELATEGAPDLTDPALAHAAAQVVGSIGEVHPLEATAMRLAKVLAPDREELSLLIVEALADRRLSLAIALVARAFGTDYSAIRDVVLDPEGERFWLVLRALDLDRRTIARIGYLLCESDGRRSSDEFADTLGAVMMVPSDVAGRTMADLRLPHPFRDALDLFRGRGAQ